MKFEMKPAQIGLKMLILLLSILFIGLIGIFVFLLIKSPGEPEQYLNSKGEQLKESISEKTFVEIGGIKQGMFIKSKDINRPVLLYIHGGPSFPNYFLIDKYKPELEDFFTVCYWEQRGGGLSYNSEVTLESMNFEQLSNDAIEVANYLRKRFRKEKIYTFAHSGGTIIALKAISKSPELFKAYIAMAQITNQSESEKIAFNYILQQYQAIGDSKSLNKLLEFNELETESDILGFFTSPIRDEAMHELGIGTMRNLNSIFWDIFVPVWTCKAYTLSEKFNIWKSKFSFFPKTNLNKELLNINFNNTIQHIDIPVYFFSGKFDLTVNINLSKAFLKKIQAPLKGFYTFNNSAHSPLFEETEKFRQIIAEDVLQGKINLADAID